MEEVENSRLRIFRDQWKNWVLFVPKKAQDSTVCFLCDEQTI